MPKMIFSTTHLKNVFAEEGKYDAVKNLMFDLASGREIYDADEERVISTAEANDKVRKVIFEILELGEKPTKRDRKRAMKRHGIELFEIIEEVVDLQVATGFKDNEFFNDFVDYRNIADGDSIEFYTEDNTILSITKVSGQHHDFVLQRLGEGEAIPVPMAVYGAAVGADIDRYLVGQEDWAKLTNKLAQAFIVEVQNQIYAAVMNAAANIPAQAQFVGTGTLSASTKNAFDTIIENVEAANESGSYILGTKTALKKINDLSDVNWRAEIQKEDVARMGRLGSYESTTLIEIPQRFANGDVTGAKLVSNNILLIMPAVSNDKFVKFVDQGETEIYEITEKGKQSGRIDDIMEMEMTRAFGLAVVIGRYFGKWTFVAG